MSNLLGENDFKKIKETLIDMILNGEKKRQIKNELLVIQKRMEYLNGNISLEEMQSFIHDTLLDDGFYCYQIEYQCLLYQLLKKNPEEYDIGFIEEIKRNKLNAMRKKQKTYVTILTN